MQRYLDKLEVDLGKLGFVGNSTSCFSGGGIDVGTRSQGIPDTFDRVWGRRPAQWRPPSWRGLPILIASFPSTWAAPRPRCAWSRTVPRITSMTSKRPGPALQKGSGLPLKVPVVDMIEIGAGGGSLAHIDASSGLMKVGPRSAGAKPGPVCYGLGGSQPTVTDADLVLGRLDPAYFLGGELTLDPGRVQQAFADTITPELGIESQDAALGVQRIVDETMAAATRMHLAEKGRDPRQYTIIAFGGAGPVHAWNLARLLKVRQVVVPLGAGVASALGFLVAPPATDMVRSYVARLDRVDWSHVNALLSEMQKLGRDLLTEAGADPEQIIYSQPRTCVMSVRVLKCPSSFRRSALERRISRRSAIISTQATARISGASWKAPQLRH